MIKWPKDTAVHDNEVVRKHICDGISKSCIDSYRITQWMLLLTI